MTLFEPQYNTRISIMVRIGDFVIWRSIMSGEFHPYPQNVKFPPRPIFRVFCGPLASLAMSLSHSHKFKFVFLSTSIHACTKYEVSS